MTTPEQQPIPEVPVTPIKKSNRALKIVLGSILGVLALCVGSTVIMGLSGALDTKPESKPNTSPSSITTTEPVIVATTPTKPIVKPGPFKTINDRTWALIAKDPDAHKGEYYVIYGEVTQADTSTGNEVIRANVGGQLREPSYGYVDYPTNVLLGAYNAEVLKNVVVNDLFRADVIVVGTFSYETVMGAKITVPLLYVNSIWVTESTK